MSVPPPLVIVNPASASGKTRRKWPTLSPHVVRALPDCRIHLTERSGEAESVSREAIEGGCLHVVAVGGDGTVHEVVNGFFDADGASINPEVTLSILPMGTGSDLCRSLGLPRDPRKAIDLLNKKGTAMDAGWVSFPRADHESADHTASRAFVNIASVGLSGQVARHFEAHGKGGALSYLTGIFTASKGYNNQPLEFNLQDIEGASQRIQRTTFTCAIANAQYFGNGMHVAPNAQINDGQFQVVIVGDLGPLEVVRRLLPLYKGRHLNKPKFESYDASSVLLETRGDEAVWVELDGEASGALPARFDLKRQAFKVTLGAHPPAINPQKEGRGDR
jgi:diacylglycerol kinase (ATP)